MNILLTTACTKGCSFCFAQKNTPQIMSLENFKKLLDFIQASRPIPYFKLMGGEPSQHPLFTVFMDELIQRQLPFGLITNGLYKDPEILQSITKAITKNSLKSILLNISELDQNNNLEKIKNTYAQYLHLYKTDPLFSLSCALTLNRHKSVEEELAYVQWLTSQLEIHHLRISLDFKGDNLEDSFFINNTVYGDKIQKIIKLCLAQEIKTNGDCVVFPCQFSDKFFFQKKLPEFFTNLNTHCLGQETMPFDVYPDLSYFHCYPARLLGGPNILDFKNFQEASQELGIRKNCLNSTISPPETCKNCNYYKDNICNSLCLGCQKLPETSALLAPRA